MALLLLVILFATLGIQRRRKGKVRKLEGNITLPLPESEILTDFSIQEIAHNSLVGNYRELPDNGKVELQDEKAPSGSAKEIMELPTAAPLVYHELVADTVSHSLLKMQKDKSISCIKSRSVIYVSTGIFTQSKTSQGRPSSPCVETIITSSPRPKSLKSNQTSSSPPPWPTPLELDRPLPPTPISESPQISPITPVSKRLGRRRHPLRAPPNSASTSGIIDYVSPTSPDAGFEARESREYSSLSESSMELEVVIPPGEEGPAGSSASSAGSVDREGKIIGDFSWI